MSDESIPKTPTGARGGARAGAGRKRFSDEKLVSTSVQFPPSQILVLDEMAANRGLGGRAELIREVVTRFLKGVAKRDAARRAP